jgi:hypothetical protein
MERMITHQRMILLTVIGMHGDFRKYTSFPILCTARDGGTAKRLPEETSPLRLRKGILDTTQAFTKSNFFDDLNRYDC